MEILKTFDQFTQIMEIVREMPLVEFLSVYAVVFEAKCKEDDLDVIETLNTLYDQMRTINETLGNL